MIQNTIMNKILLLIAFVVGSVGAFGQCIQKTPYAYIANYNDGTVSVINTINNQLTNTIKVGGHPAGVSISPNGSTVYVANNSLNNFGYDTVNVINTSTDSVISGIAVQSNPGPIVINPNGNLLYVANYSSNSVSVINTSNNTVVATIPVGSDPSSICINATGTRVYVANLSSNSVSVINTSNNTVLSTINLGISPNQICLSDNGANLYISFVVYNVVKVVNTSTNSITASIPVGSSPRSLCFKPNSNKLYVANGYSNSISVINTNNNSVIKSISVGSAPSGVSITPDGSKLFVTNSSSNYCSIINTINDSLINYCLTGLRPEPHGNFIANIPPKVKNINFTSCNNVVYNGITFTSSASLKDTAKTLQGCDSVYNNINITVTGIGISGNIITHLGKPIKLVDGILNNGLTLQASSLYRFGCIKSGSNNTIRLSKNNDINKTNGVTTLDLALVQSHVLGKTLLNSPYKLIAADVNGDGLVTTLDVVYLKRLILGLDTTFTKTSTGEKRLWAFVDSSYQFPDTTNPFPFKDSISYIGLSANKTNQTFIGVKLGDVNWDWNPALARPLNIEAIIDRKEIILEKRR